MTDIERLYGINLFKGIQESTLNWMFEKGEILQFKKDEKIFKSGEPVNHLFILLEGKVHLQIEVGGQLINFTTFEKGGVTGLLPYSKMKTAQGFGIVAEECLLYKLHKDHFSSLESKSPEIIDRLVDILKMRVRESVRMEQQREKMAALGKLSAGLAHELNNPSSAIQRFSSELNRYTYKIGQQTIHLLENQISCEELRIALKIIDNLELPEPRRLSMLQQSEIEDDYDNWLDDHDLEDLPFVAENFIETGIKTDDLDPLVALGTKKLRALICWMDNVITVRRLNHDIGEAGHRISELVHSIKSYSHMDSDNSKQEADVVKGLSNTLAILNHKIKEKNISVSMQFDDHFPEIPIFVGELNQVWTNLLDNAIDALPLNGYISIKGEWNDSFVMIHIEDNGPGIPYEIQSKIFEPFYTTKNVGEGTGLGLDIVKRIMKQHQGDIHLRAEPGKTIFSITLPR